MATLAFLCFECSKVVFPFHSFIKRGGKSYHHENNRTQKIHWHFVQKEFVSIGMWQYYG